MCTDFPTDELPALLLAKAKIYIRTQSKCSKRWKQSSASSAIKQLLETLFLTTKMYTGFTTEKNRVFPLTEKQNLFC